MKLPSLFATGLRVTAALATLIPVVSETWPKIAAESCKVSTTVITVPRFIPVMVSWLCVEILDVVPAVAVSVPPAKTTASLPANHHLHRSAVLSSG